MNTRKAWSPTLGTYVDVEDREIERRLAIAREALRACDEMINVALPQFDWGKSALDARAITLLNETPVKVTQALKEIDR